jgi:hypothetical protein
LENHLIWQFIHQELESIIYALKFYILDCKGNFTFKTHNKSWAPVAHAYSLSYLGDSDREDLGLRPGQANSLQDPVSQIIREKWTGGVAQAVESLLCKSKVLSSNPVPT